MTLIPPPFPHGLKSVSFINSTFEPLPWYPTEQSCSKPQRITAQLGPSVHAWVLESRLPSIWSPQWGPLQLCLRMPSVLEKAQLLLLFDFVHSKLLEDKAWSSALQSPVLTVWLPDFLNCMLFCGFCFHSHFLPTASILVQILLSPGVQKYLKWLCSSSPHMAACLPDAGRRSDCNKIAPCISITLSFSMPFQPKT